MPGRKKSPFIASIVGARPQFVKAAPIDRAFRKLVREGGTRLKHRIIHTGQHYDFEMSRKIFGELELPEPDHHLNINGGTHAEMTGRILDALDALFEKERPRGVLLYGDTNSTLAGALAAKKHGLPVAHVEAGLRSFNRNMPEEINRIATDALSSLLFCPTRRAVERLKKENVPGEILRTGDVMLDIFRQTPKSPQKQREALGLPAGFGLVTIHRPQNTDDPKILGAIVEGLRRVSRKLPLVFPCHPRTKKALSAANLADSLGESVALCPPMGYLELQIALKSCRVLITDSGGLQKEAFFAARPAVTLRPDTEWPETLEGGANRLCAPRPLSIVRAVNRALNVRVSRKRPFGDGRAAEKIVSILNERWG